MLPLDSVNWHAEQLLKCQEYLKSGLCKKRDCQHCIKGDHLRNIQYLSPDDQRRIFHTANYLSVGSEYEREKKMEKIKKAKHLRILWGIVAALSLYIWVFKDWDNIGKGFAIFFFILGGIILSCLMIE